MSIRLKKQKHRLLSSKDHFIHAIRDIMTITTIRSKLILSFLIPIFFIILLGVVSYNKAAEGLRNSYESSTSEAINMTSKYLQLGLNSVEALSTQYQNEEIIKKYFSGIDKDDVLINRNNFRALLNSFISKESTDEFISEISILSDKYNNITTNSSVKENIVSGFYETELGQSFRKKINYLWLGSNTYLDESLGIGPDQYFLRLIRNVSGSDSLIVIDIDAAKIRSVISEMDFDPTVIIGLVTPDGKEIISDNGADEENLFINQNFYEEVVNSELSKDAFYVDYKGSRHLFIYSKVGNTGSILCSLIPKSTILSQADSIKSMTIIIVILACIIAILTGAYISYGIDVTIKDIITKLKKASKGDLTVNISTKRKDEFFILINEINNTFTNVKQLIGQVKGLSKDVTEASIHVATTSEDFLKSTGDISNAMNEIEKGINQQAKDAEECLHQMDNLSNKITLLGNNTCNIETITETTKIKIDEGTRATTELNEQTKSTKEITRVIVEEIESLAEKSKSINNIITVINDISQQTNLLSLNASIEAARAGEIGKGFAVVANEIRNLADQTRNSVNDIKRIINSIQDNTRNVVMTAKQVEDVVLLQDTAVNKTTNSYLFINESVDDLMVHIRNIISNVGDIEESRVNTLGAIENISAVLEEIAASSNNISQNSDNQLISVDTLNNWASDLNINAEHLAYEVQKFTV